MALRLNNTLTQELEEFHPQDGKTVPPSTTTSIGNFRTFTFQDILRRTHRPRCHLTTS